MKKLNEREIAQGYIGKTVNTERLVQCFTHIDDGRSTLCFEEAQKGKEYHAFCNNYYDEKEWDIFKLTDTLYEYWEDGGIDFRVILYIENTNIVVCKIYKHKDDLGGFCGRPINEDLVPSQQEIRIFRRIMDYITA